MIDTILDMDTPHLYHCLLCDHTSSVYSSFMHHMSTHDTQSQEITE